MSLNKKFWNFKQEGTVGELTLYGDIASSTWWGDEITPKQFKTDLDALGAVDTLNVFINSGGGDVFAGQAIYSMLKRHAANKVVYIDGLAASAASLIAMAGDKIIMPANAMMMVHKAWTIALGNADELRKMADDMDKMDSSIAQAYETKTGKTKEEILAIMEAETWMTAEEAVTDGFADEIEQEKKLAASIDGGFLMLNNQKFDLENYKNFRPEAVEAYRAVAVPEPVAIDPPDLSDQDREFRKLKNKLLGGQ